jgi:1-acyl-sn-glycerol-3-phosphate acyltransferase
VTLLYRFCRDAAWLFFRLYGRAEVIGREKIPPTGPIIFVCNHVSYLDPPLVGSAARRECAFMARHDLWNNRWLGRLISRLNAFPVHRDRPDRATIRKALEVLERGLALVLFPEGTRSEDGRLQKAAPGVTLIVQKSGAPVIPTAVIGPEVMWPPHQKKLRRVKLKIVFGDPLFFTPDSSREEIVRGIMGAIADLLTAHGRPMTAREEEPEENTPLHPPASGGRAVSPLPPAQREERERGRG